MGMAWETWAWKYLKEPSENKKGNCSFYKRKKLKIFYPAAEHLLQCLSRLTDISRDFLWDDRISDTYCFCMGFLSLFKSVKPCSNYEIALWRLIISNTDHRSLTWGRNNTQIANPTDRLDCNASSNIIIYY